jgi:hypothetical protein
LKDPPNPAATNLFKTYVKNAPDGTFPRKTSTYQGLYCMTADGVYLSGKFARQTRDMASEAFTSGLTRWGKIAGQRSYQPKAVPTNRLAIYGGEKIRKGGIKLEVAYRDLPRGEVRRPGNSQFPNPYNLGWFDFTPAEARSFVTESREKVAIRDGIFRKLARMRLKDAVRGQMNDWDKGEIKGGQLFTQLVSSKGSRKTFRLSGSADMAAGERTFSPRFHGTVTFDSATGEFTDFRLIAAGQRSGKGGANGRETDLGPAPIAIALTLYQP